MPFKAAPWTDIKKMQMCLLHTVVLRRLLLGVLCSLMAVVISACSSSGPDNPHDLCAVFQEKDDWYTAAHKVHDKYGVPINVAMAIMFQESGYRGDARPPMRWFLFIPLGRASSAYGYAQALDGVWEDYVREQGSYFSDRDDFEDALDFIAWYMTKTKTINQIPFADAYNQYLNYHEGWNGYSRETYKTKDWLLTTAKRVQDRADTYRKQLLQCNLY